jgi:hypothetical protein
MKMALFSLVSLSRLFILSGLEQRKASARLLLKKKIIFSAGGKSHTLRNH